MVVALRLFGTRLLRCRSIIDGDATAVPLLLTISSSGSSTSAFDAAIPGGDLIPVLVLILELVAALVFT